MSAATASRSSGQPEAGLYSRRTATRAGCYVGRIEGRDPAGHVIYRREPLADVDCRDLVDVLGLVLSIELNPGNRPPPPPAPAKPPEPPEPAKPPEPPLRADCEKLPVPSEPAKPPEPTKPAPTPIAWQVGAGVHVDFGIAPRPLVGPKLEAGFRRGLFSLRGELRWDPRASASLGYLGEAPTADARMLLAGGVVGCIHGEWHASFAGCLVGELGYLQRALATDAGDKFQQATVYAGAGTGALVEVPLPGKFYLDVTARLLGTTRFAAPRSEGPPKTGAGMGTVAGLAGGLGASVGVAF